MGRVWWGCYGEGCVWRGAAMARGACGEGCVLRGVRVVGRGMAHPRPSIHQRKYRANRVDFTQSRARNAICWVIARPVPMQSGPRVAQYLQGPAHAVPMCDGTVFAGAASSMPMDDGPDNCRGASRVPGLCSACAVHVFAPYEVKVRPPTPYEAAMVRSLMK